MRVAAFSAAAVVVFGLAVAMGLGAPRAPSPAGAALLPAVSLPTVLAAGFADGFNPCAFTVLLLFIASLLAAVHGRGAGDSAWLRTRVIGLGSIYVAAVFVTYLALGIGLLATVDLFTTRHVPARLGAVLSIALGLWMLKDALVPDLGLRLAAPTAVGNWARAAARRMTIPSLIGAGILIGLCTLPCSGAIYLAVLSLLAAQASALRGFGYLVLYNVAFVVPLVVILVAASARPTMNRLARWNLHHREATRLGLGSAVIAMGFLILATI